LFKALNLSKIQGIINLQFELHEEQVKNIIFLQELQGNNG